MSIIFRTRAEDLLQCRFAISPLGETADAIRSLAWPAATSGQLAWQRQVRAQLPGLQIGPLAAILSARGYQPDFLSPAPPGPFTEISAELDEVRAIPPARLTAELAQAGLAATLNDLDPRVSYQQGILRCAMTAEGELQAAGTQLVLIPSVFAWPGAGVNFDPPAVIYPARGTAALWQPSAHDPGDLARLIGATRARILSALAEPASTSGLAARCGLPASTTSEHLAILRANGLITTTRTGRYLRHRQTPLGVALTPAPPR